MEDEPQDDHNPDLDHYTEENAEDNMVQGEANMDFEDEPLYDQDAEVSEHVEEEELERCEIDADEQEEREMEERANMDRRIEGGRESEAWKQFEWELSQWKGEQGG